MVQRRRDLDSILSISSSNPGPKDRGQLPGDKGTGITLPITPGSTTLSSFVTLGEEGMATLLVAAPYQTKSVRNGGPAPALGVLWGA